MKFVLLMIVGLLVNSAAQIDHIKKLDHVDDIKKLDHAGCVNILNRIKVVGITVDATGSQTGSMLTEDEKFNNKVTKTAIQIYERDCLEMSGLLDFECPVAIHTDVKEFAKEFFLAMNY